jgi:hypothetical protein
MLQESGLRSTRSRGWLTGIGLAAAVTLVASAPIAPVKAQSSTGSPASPAPGAAPADHPELVTRFLEGTGEPLLAYEAIRRLEAKSGKMNLEGWLVVRTELDPKTGFRYEVLDEGGSQRVRRRVLYAALDAELRTNQAGTWFRAAFTPDNYVFRVEPGGGRYETLRVTPRRKDPVLIDGLLFVTPGDADLKRVEGVLSKTPSFWAKQVGMVRQYGRVDGVRVPLVIESLAHVRILGPSEFRMTFEYESINGRQLNDRARAAAQ